MAGVTINVLDPEFYVDPWQAYRWLRDEALVYWDPVQKLWVISRCDDILDVEKDTGRYSSSEGSRPLVDQREDLSMINMDDPRHQEQRRLVSRRFTPRAVRGHQDHVRGIVTGILDAVAPLGQCEAVEAIASRLPAIMIVTCSATRASCGSASAAGLSRPWCFPGRPRRRARRTSFIQASRP